MLQEIGLGPDTAVEPGDWIALYTGSLDAPDEAELVGYGELTEVAPAEGGWQLRYALRDETDMARAAGMAIQQDSLDPNLTEEEMREIEDNALRSIEENDFFNQAGDYIASLIFEDEPADLQTKRTGTPCSRCASPRTRAKC